MIDEERVLKEGKRLLEEFSRELGELPRVEETHYIVDLKNVLREDGAGEKNPEFRERFEKLAPAWREGYIVVKKQK